MFTKYTNQFAKVEAEWVQEILDLHGGDEPKAREAVLSAVDRLIAASKNGTRKEVATFDRDIDACCFANPMWWIVGIKRLDELGRIAATGSAAPQTGD